jgi:transcription factor IIIB subunit 2
MWDSNDLQETYCMACGYVVHSSNNLTSNPGFQKAGTTMGGEIIDFETGRGVGSRSGRNCTEITVARAKEAIRGLANALKGLTDVHVERATRFYKIALLEHKFSQGRRREHVLAACLYLVCRLDQKPHMLIDFSDALPSDSEGLPVKVYKLGQTYMQLTRILKIETIPLNDPALYLERFAQQLEFGNKTTTVVQTALRFIQRMNRDWIQTGRRPSGLCGAALMMASRLHGFNRTVDDIVDVVRIGDHTLLTRIREFTNTPAAELTPSQFHTMDLNSNTLPPCLTKVKINPKDDPKDDPDIKKSTKQRKKDKEKHRKKKTQKIPK